MFLFTLKHAMLAMIFIVGFSSLSFADFFVIPVNKKIKNIVTVAKSGGQFTDIQAAIDSISDASENNPYVVFVAPGVYSLQQQLVMKSYVDIVGSGENVTKITGDVGDVSVGPNAALVVGKDGSVLRDLSVENTGFGAVKIGIIAYEIVPTEDHPRFKVVNVSTFTQGGTNARGIVAIRSYIDYENIIVKVDQGGAGTAVGILNEVVSGTIKNAVVQVKNSTDVIGIDNKTANPEIFNSYISVSDADSIRGINSNTSAHPVLYYSIIKKPLGEGVYTSTEIGSTLTHHTTTTVEDL